MFVRTKFAIIFIVITIQKCVFKQGAGIGLVVQLNLKPTGTSHIDPDALYIFSSVLQRLVLKTLMPRMNHF